MFKTGNKRVILTPETEIQDDVVTVIESLQKDRSDLLSFINKINLALEEATKPVVLWSKIPEMMDRQAAEAMQSSIIDLRDDIDKYLGTFGK